MRVLLSLVLYFAMLVPAFANGPQFGNMLGHMAVGIFDGGAAASETLNTAFVNGTSGDFFGVRFVSPVTQTNGDLTLYVYCTATAGTTDNTAAVFMNGPSGAEDDDRPATGAVAATSDTVDASGCGTPGWLTYTFTNSVTLVAGATYWAGVTNTEADPATNTFSVQRRGSLDAIYQGQIAQFAAQLALDGFSASDSTATSSSAPVVVKFDDGSLMGMPFVSTLAHASNTNYRGFRVNFDEDVVASCASFGVSSSAIANYAIFQGSTTVLSFAGDRQEISNGSHICFTPTTLTGGLDYDIVFNLSSNSTGTNEVTMGTSPPADVQALNPGFSYVDGTAAGSMVETATSSWTGALFLDNNPEQTGTGAGSTNSFGGAVGISGMTIN